jgi:hypothetical protein
MEGLEFETPLRAITGFLQALYFSLSVYFYLMLYLVKNKALGESLKFEEMAL